MLSSVNIHNLKKEEIEKTNTEIFENPKKGSIQQFYCNYKQLLIIVIPISVIFLFAVIFIPVYVVEKTKNDDDKTQTSNNSNNSNNYELYDEYVENVINITYAILTPKDGYDNIFIFLGGISDVATKYFDFFKSTNTFIPKGTKIYFLSGQPRQMQFMIDWGLGSDPVPGWFNVGADATLKPTSGDFTEAKESLNLVLDEIDRIKNIENVDYKNIFLGGFSQGGMMTNYILLNSRHELGGYIAFSGYVFDHDFSENQVLTSLNDVQTLKLQSKKNYHILATHSYQDDTVPYSNAAPSYQAYYPDYTDFKLLSFGNLLHKFREQPIHPFVKQWLKESMGK